MKTKFMALQELYPIGENTAETLFSSQVFSAVNMLSRANVVVGESRRVASHVFRTFFDKSSPSAYIYASEEKRGHRSLVIEVPKLNDKNIQFKFDNVLLRKGEEVVGFASVSKLAALENAGLLRPTSLSLEYDPGATGSGSAVSSKIETQDAETITENLKVPKPSFKVNLLSIINGSDMKLLQSKSTDSEMKAGQSQVRDSAGDMNLGSIVHPRTRRRFSEILERRNSILESWRSDVCSGGELPEVEIISLLEEQIPRYRLRADTLTQFAGYENEDWYIPSPALKPDEVDLNLTPDQIRETLNYFKAVIIGPSADLDHGGRAMSQVNNLPEPQPATSEDSEEEDGICTCPGDCEVHEGQGERSNFLYFMGKPRHGNVPIKFVRSLLLDEKVLCSNRVSQMTKTYNDIEAVTRLLEEKEKDLELTARIGKELLAHNQKLETNVTTLEAELKTVNEKLTQLSHELLKKTELIQVLTNDVDESGSEAGTPTTLRCINLELMHRRIGSLEEENKLLRKEAYQLAKDTDDCEEAEQRLVLDIASQLASANMEVTGLADDLLRYKEENRQQHEQITSLSSKLADADVNVHKLTLENEQLSNMLHITKENQSKLATELADLKDRYAEVMTLLHDTQDQLRKQRRKATPVARGGSYFPSLSSTLNPDSLASELESSLYSEQSLDSGISTDRVPNYKKVFETVRCASRNSSSSCASANESPMHHPRGVPQPQFSFGNTVMSSTISSGPRMSSFITPQTGPKSLDQSRRTGGSVYSSSLSYPSMDSFGHSDSDFSVVTDSEDSYPGGVRAGVPGVPGAADLEAALRRLTPAEVLARRATLSMGSYDYIDGSQTSPTYLPFGCRTPDSIMSTGSSRFSNQSGGWKLPEKLQIVKPMEGSLTLAAWQQLATPTLGGLLDDRPGVKIRGGKLLEELGFELYSLSDLEEDEYCNPGKSFQHTGSIYTYTNSTVLHPDDSTSVTPSVHGSKMCTVSNSCQNSGAPPTPVCLSRRGSTSTFSTTLGLAKMLNERGIKAVTPSALCTPCGDRSFSPTATPCNSPDGTPPPSPPPSPSPYNPSKFAGFFSSGANLLRRTLTGECERANSRKSKRLKSLLSRSERKALKDIKLMEQLESIGLENIMSTTASSISPVTLQGALYTRRITKSPMTQLTSLKTAVSSSRTDKKSDIEKMRAETSAPISPSPVSRDLGVPGHPGSGELYASLTQGNGHKQRSQIRGTVRPDLGKVLGKVPLKDVNKKMKNPLHNSQL